MVCAHGEVAAKHITTEVFHAPNHGEKFKFVNTVMRLSRVQKAGREGDGDPRAVMSLFKDGPKTFRTCIACNARVRKDLKELILGNMNDSAFEVEQGCLHGRSPGKSIGGFQAGSERGTD